MHLGMAADLRFLEGGAAVANFPLATSEWINKNGVKVELTEWHNIVVWRSLAENAAKILTKGSLVYLEGKVRTRSFLDKMNHKKYTNRSRTIEVIDQFVDDRK